jgi:hypothetical protein
MIGGFTYVMTSSTSTSGSSGKYTAGTKTPFPKNPDPKTPATDQDIEWRNVSSATSAQEWQSNGQYSIGQAVCDFATNLAGNPKNCAAGHTYVVDRVLTGKSGPQDPSLQAISNPPATVQDGDLLWAEAPDWKAGRHPLKAWAPTKHFDLNDFVQAQNGLYYRVIRVIGGVSGVEEPKFPITEYCTVVDPVIRVKDDVNVKGNFVEWQDLGSIRPRKPGDCSAVEEHFVPRITIPDWNQVHSKNALVPQGTVIFEPGVEGGRYYEAIRPGTTGDISPFTNLTPPMLITWLDSGTAPPSTIATGQPADQTVSLINLTLPQTHTLARFNIAAGAELAFARPPSFGWTVPTAPGVNLPTSGVTVTTSSGSTTYYFVPASAITTGSSQTPIPTTVPTTGASSSSVAVEPQSECTYGLTALQDTSPYSKNPSVANASPTTPVPVYAVYECPSQIARGPRPVDAVLAVTAYLLPVDEEIPWQWEFWKSSAWRGWVPAPSFGMSLTNPTGNFYLGGSNEFGVRNLQLFYGRAFLNQQTKIAPAVSQAVWGGQATQPTVATTATVRQGWYFGATFNLSNFIQSIIGGGGAK